MNKLLIIGRLTAEPELAQTSAGTNVCHFSVAVDRTYAAADGEKKTDFFRCTAWRGNAELIAKYLHKGDLVAVSGSIELNKYTASDGSERNTTEVQVREVQFLSPKKDEDEPQNKKGSKPKLEPMDIGGDIPF